MANSILNLFVYYAVYQKKQQTTIIQSQQLCSLPLLDFEKKPNNLIVKIHSWQKLQTKKFDSLLYSIQSGNILEIRLYFFCMQRIQKKYRAHPRFNDHQCYTNRMFITKIRTYPQKRINRISFVNVKKVLLLLMIYMHALKRHIRKAYVCFKIHTYRMYILYIRIHTVYTVCAAQTTTFAQKNCMCRQIETQEVSLLHTPLKFERYTSSKTPKY
eukprot:TRINITY_DN6505_c1_g1_i1.p1 TRINITY_DN6505_c1_g1~~TRINITY_DN6505_c1_g1_i1.p1  ORF type:complete len:214 (+),score=-20.03 TRINITY_DN6505_c1_g1_i1:148-789(+)